MCPFCVSEKNVSIFLNKFKNYFFLDVNFFYLCSLPEKPYYVFAIFEAIIRRGMYSLPAGSARRLDQGMRLFPAMQEIFVRLARLSLITLPVVDMFLNYGHFSFAHTTVFVAWTTLLAVSIQIAVALSVSLVQQAYLISVYFILRLLFIREKLTRALQRFKRAKRQTTKLSDSSHVKRRVIAGQSASMEHRVLNSWRRPLWRHLHELTTLGVQLLRIVDQFKYMPAVAYYICSGVIDFNLYLVISRSTGPLLRVIASCMGSIFATDLYLAFALMARLNSKSKRLLPSVNYCLFRVVPLLPGRNPTSRLALAETQHMIASDRLSLNMGDVFRMTRLQLLLAVFNIIQNVFLIIDLNE